MPKAHTLCLAITLKCSRQRAIDPHAESYYHLSPYSYCGGNPVNRIDPTGMDWYQNNQTSYYTWYDGDGAREGFTYIGGVGCLLGEFESKINNILIDVYKNNKGLYSEGRTVDITNPNKGAIFPSQLSQMDDFLDEFVFGYGPEISILTSNHPYTKALQSDARVIESQQDLRAGNTHFYLLPNEMGIESFLYHDGGEEGIFYPINHKGTVHDIYWNQQYIIIKCSEQKEENWYLMRNIKDYNYPKFMIQHFLNENDYNRVLDSLGISEKNMEHTDGTIPWSLHL